MRNKGKRVLIVATSGKTQGGISSVINAHEDCAYWKEYNIERLETHTDGSKWKKLRIALFAFLRFIFIAPRYDLIHFHLSEIASTLRKVPFFMVAKLYRKKTIIHFHSFDPQTTVNGKHKSVYKYLFSHADKVIVLSLSWKKWIKEYLGLSENIVVVLNPCITPISADIQKDRLPVILYAGAINDRKGYKDLINAFGMIANKVPDWKLILAGTGEIEKGKQLATELCISSQVSFPGWVIGTEKNALFATASIFCLPSYAEGFPTAVLDACSYGLPFITTPVGGIPDIINHNENGLLFEPGDIDTLSQLLFQLISDEVLRKRLADASLELAQTTFSLQEIGQQVRSIYQELLQ